MKYMGLSEIREKYLSFFESKGHLRLKSFSLVPDHDKSLLLINSGMAPMKKYFTGEITPPRKRVTTCQKCIRTPDLERVGHTARHGTYFEMLGNFSFGDYFKKEAIAWAWEFLTETMEIDADLLWPSVYESDDEAYAIWRDDIGVPEKRIVRLGKEDNFWEHGTGPCGPCSEIYFDRGEKYGCGSPDCKPGCDCDRYMEIWNNVFSQFNNMGDGTYTELEHKNIDTGMGLERLACVVQGVDNMFEVDTIRRILDKVCEISGVPYEAEGGKDISIRAITDHARAATFMISDGIIPSNEGRGYVLRRLIRRACRHGRLLGIRRAFLQELCEVVIAENKAGYPELDEKQELIKKVISVEENSFARTIDQGLGMLEALTASGKTLSGEDAFKLYDTYGFPLDLTKDILAEKGMTLDEDTFRELMQRQRDMARSSRKASDAESWKSDGMSFDDTKDTEFVGYDRQECDAVILALAADGETAGFLPEGTDGIIVLDKTPFYAESGGQAGDSGVIRAGDTVFTVTDTQKSGDVFMHIGKLKKGTLTVGDSVTAAIDRDRRAAIARNHTAAHLLQAALRAALGTHVEQAGQFVSEKSVRFDFTHFSAMTKDELKTVAQKINRDILSAIPVEKRSMPLEEAKKLGAMALFGEKYGDTVRVVSAGSSVEFCGGTHVDNTAQIGSFHILSESGIAGGVRRIEAVTGEGVLKLLETLEDTASSAARELKLNQIADLPARCAALTAQIKQKDREIEILEGRIADAKIDALMDGAKKIGKVRVVAAAFEDQKSASVRKMGEKLSDKAPGVVSVLICREGDKATIAVTCGKQAVEAGAHAGKIAGQVAAVTDGRGGGKPAAAMAGVGDMTKIAEALESVYGIVENLL